MFSQILYEILRLRHQMPPRERQHDAHSVALLRNTERRSVPGLRNPPPLSMPKPDRPDKCRLLRRGTVRASDAGFAARNSGWRTNPAREALSISPDSSHQDD